MDLNMRQINPEDMLWVFQLSVSQLEVMLRQQRVQTHKCLHADSESWGASAQTHRLSPDWGAMNDEFMLEEEYPTRFDESCRIMEARYINNEPYCRHREEMGKRLCVVFCWVVFSLCSLSGWCSLSSLASSSFFFFFFLSSLVPSLGPAELEKLAGWLWAFLKVASNRTSCCGFIMPSTLETSHSGNTTGEWR